MRLSSCLAHLPLVLGLATVAGAQPLTLPAPDETPVFAPYALVGISLGSEIPVSESYQDQAAAFVRGGLVSEWYVYPTTSLTMEAVATAPDGGAGFAMGLSQDLLPLRVSPFVGGALGARWVGTSEDRGGKFGDRFGPTAALQAGLHLFRKSQVQVRARGSWEMVFDDERDQDFVLDFSVLWAFGRPALPAIETDGSR